MSDRGSRVFGWVVRRPRLLVLLSLASMAALSLFAAGLPTDNGLDIWLPRSDPERVLYDEFRGVFGSDDFILVAGVDRPAGELERYIGPLADSLADLSGAGRVVRPAFSRVPRTPLYAEGDDGRVSAAVLVRIRDGLDTAGRATLVDEVLAVASRSAGGPWRVAGPAVINRALDRASRSSLWTLVPFTVAGVVLVLLLGLRSLRAAAAVIGGAGLACGATLGVVGISGGTMNMVLSVLPALTLVLATAYALHPVTRFLFSPPIPGESAGDRWARVLASTFRPALVAAATTAAGIGSLCFAGLPPVRALGAYGAAGILIAFVISYTFVPAVLTLVRLRPSPRARSGTRSIADRLSRAVLRGRVLLPACFLAVIAVSVAGMSRLRVESSVLRMLDPESRVLADSRAIQEHLTGLTPLEIWIEGDRATVLSAETTAAVARLAGECGRLDRVTHVVSPLTSPANLRIAGDRAHLRITLLSLLGNSREFLARVEAVRDIVATGLPEGVSARVTGAIPLLARVQESLVVSQIRSFGAAFVLVSLLLLVDLRRPGLAALSLVPNVLPVLVAAGAMGWFGIPLDAATIAVAGIAFGVAVDDTVHVIHRWFATGGNLESVLSDTLRPVILTTLAAMGGFAAFAASPFPPARRLGFLVAGAAAVAVVADLVLLPGLLAALQPRGKELST